MSFPPSIMHVVTFEKNGFDTTVSVKTLEDGKCIESKEIELDDDELRALENEILRQRLKEQGCEDYGVTIKDKNLVIKCKKNIRIKPIDEKSIAVIKEEDSK